MHRRKPSASSGRLQWTQPDRGPGTLSDCQSFYNNIGGPAAVQACSADLTSVCSLNTSSGEPVPAAAISRAVSGMILSAGRRCDLQRSCIFLGALAAARGRDPAEGEGLVVP